MAHGLAHAARQEDDAKEDALNILTLCRHLCLFGVFFLVAMLNKFV